MRRRWISLLFLIVWPVAGFAQNCCMPKLGEDDPSARLVEGVQSATVVLLVAPVLLIGGGICWFRRWNTEP